MDTFVVIWSPEGRVMEAVEAKDRGEAISKVLSLTKYKKYRKFRGEVYAELQSVWERRTKGKD